MPLLIGRFAGVVLLGVVAGHALGVESDPEPREGVVASETAPGDPSSGSGQRSAEVESFSRAVDLTLGGVHVVWAGVAGVILIRRLRRPRATGTEESAGLDASALPWLLLFGAAFMWLAQMLGSYSAGALIDASEASESEGTLRGSALLVFGAYAGALLAFGFLATLAPEIGRSLGRRPRARDALVALGAYALAHPFVWLVGWASSQVARLVSGGKPLDPLAHHLLRDLVASPLDAWWLATIGLAVVGAPIVEEVLYRGLIQNGLTRLTGSAKLAIVLTSLGFAAMHVGSVVPHALPILFLLSVAFGVTYHRTRRLSVAIGMHMIFNAANLTLALMLG